MLRIRLHRVGRRNDPSFRLVVVESTVGPQNMYLELLGSYNPVQKKRSFNADRIMYWIQKGAQPSDTVHNLLVSENILTGEKRNVLPHKKPVKKEVDQKEEIKLKTEETPDIPPQETQQPPAPEKTKQQKAEIEVPSASPEVNTDNEKQSDENKNGKETNGSKPEQ